MLVVPITVIEAVGYSLTGPGNTCRPTVVYLTGNLSNPRALTCKKAWLRTALSKLFRSRVKS